MRTRTIFNYFPNYLLGNWYWLSKIKITEEWRIKGVVNVCNATDEIIAIEDGWVPVKVEKL